MSTAPVITATGKSHCLRCNSDAHHPLTWNKCPAFPICRKCNTIGHESDKCTATAYAVKSKETDRCFLCTNTGHFQSQCPALLKHEASGGACIRCGGAHRYTGDKSNGWKLGSQCPGGSWVAPAEQPTDASVLATQAITALIDTPAAMEALRNAPLVPRRLLSQIWDAAIDAKVKKAVRIERASADRLAGKKTNCTDDTQTVVDKNA